MWKKSKGDDFAHSLGMLHNTLTDVRVELRTSLKEGFEGTRSAGDQAVRRVGEDVTAELGRMRTDVRNVQRSGLTREDLADVQRTLDLLRDEVQRLHRAVAGPPADEPTAPGSSADAAASAEAASGSWQPPVYDRTNSTVSDPAAAPASSVDAGSATPVGGAPPEAGPALTGRVFERLVGMVTEAVVAVLREELKPLRAELTGQTEPAAARQATAVTRAGEQAAGGERAAAHAETSREEPRTGLADPPEEGAAVRRSPAADTERLRETENGPQAEENRAREGDRDLSAHRDLLRKAAQVSHAVLLCHRDTWEFLSGRAARHDHFRMPAEISDHGRHRIAAEVSGRSLIAILISLFTTRHTAREGDGDWALAATAYDRAATALADLATEGEPVTITLDDRTPASGGPEPDRERDGVQTSSVPIGKTNGTGEESERPAVGEGPPRGAEADAGDEDGPRT